MAQAQQGEHGMDHGKMDLGKMDHGKMDHWCCERNGRTPARRNPAALSSARPKRRAKRARPTKVMRAITAACRAWTMAAARTAAWAAMGGRAMMGGMSGTSHGGGKDGGRRGGDGMSGMSHAGGGMMNKMVCGFAEHVEGRLAYLKAELKLTATQTGAWSAFDEAWRAAAQKAKQKCDAADMRMDHCKPEVLNKLTMMENHMVDHLEVVRAQKAAIEFALHRFER